MVRVGLIGLGSMGRGHLNNYVRLMSGGAPVRLAAVCDIRPEALEGASVTHNLLKDLGEADLSAFAKYTDAREMLEKENLDFVDIVIPTYLHADMAETALSMGVNVLCEKPMALNAADCQRMIAARDKSGKKLMIAQCLRFWPVYELLRGYVRSGEFGKVTCAYFFRGGDTPTYGWNNWYMDNSLSGGCLLDQHIHDVDMINHLFGVPEAVSTSAVTLVPGSVNDALSTNYFYPGMVVNAQDDWTLRGQVGFSMSYRVNFEKGCIKFENGIATVYPSDGEMFVPELPAEDGYYREIAAFIDAIENDKPVPGVCLPESTMDTIRIANAEQESAAKAGAIVRL